MDCYSFLASYTAELDIVKTQVCEMIK